MVMICEKHKLAFFGLPKVASTTLKHILYELDHGYPFDRAAHGGQSVHAVYPSRPNMTPARMEALSDYWRFTVVRDPAKRILSVYANRIYDHWDLLQGRLARPRARLLGLDLKPDPDTFLRKMHRYRLQSGSIRHHTDPMVAFLGKDLSKLDAFYRFEDLDRLAADLSARTGKDIAFPRFQTNKAVRRKTRLDDLSDAGFEALMRFTEVDYKLLAGLYDRPQRRPVAAE